MVSVSTTQTILDAQQAHKDLQAKITVLKVEHEMAQRDHDAVLRETEHLREEQIRISGLMTDDREHTFMVIREAEMVVSEARELILTASSIGDASVAFVKALTAEMEQLTTSLKAAKIEKETIHDQIVQEQKKIAQHKRDIDIYRKRVEDLIEKAGLHDKIKIILA